MHVSGLVNEHHNFQVANNGGEESRTGATKESVRSRHIIDGEVCQAGGPEVWTAGKVPRSYEGT